MSATVNDYDILELLPGEFQARIAAHDLFCDIPVVIAEKGNVKLTIDQQQAALTLKNGKRGVAVIILQIVAEDDYPELKFGPLTLFPAFQIVEQVELNNDAQGTKKSARKVARVLWDIVKSTALPGLVTDLVMDKPGLQPLTTAADLAANLVKYQVNAKCYECDADNPPQQCATPVFTNGMNQFTLTCATAAATVWYTTDGSPPAPPDRVPLINGLPNTSQATTGNPIAVPPDGLLVRAAAFAPGMMPSFVTRAEITYDN